MSVTTGRETLEAVGEPNATGGRSSFNSQATAFLRRHWAIVLVVAAGLLVRATVVVAYVPFFWFTDTHG